jgi:phosphate transport system substrate-binding protein
MLLIGMLIGCTAFAITSLSIQGFAPIQRLLALGSQAPSEQPRPVPPSAPGKPLAQALRPITAAEDATALSPRASAPVRGDGGPASMAAAHAEESRSVVAASASVARTQLVIISSRMVQPFITSLALRGWGAPPKVSITSADGALASLCGAEGAGFDVATTERAMTSTELQTCQSRWFGSIRSVKVGYEVAILARSKLYGPLKLSARALFLALAQRVPDPAHPGQLLTNTYSLWSQVEDSLPQDPIRVIGPAQSAQGPTLLEPLLQAGCDSYPWIAALRNREDAIHEEICSSVRRDESYVEEAQPAAPASIQDLETNPTTLAVLSKWAFEANRDKLAASPIDGIEPTYASFAAETYPGSRPLYFHINMLHKYKVPSVTDFASLSLGAFERSGGSIVPLDGPERQAQRQLLTTQ